MRILGIVGSMRKNGNTYKVVQSALEGVREADPEASCEIVNISDFRIEPCRGCYDQCSSQPYHCVLEDDFAALCEKMLRADGLILGSPKYFPVPATLTAFMERLVCLAYSSDVDGVGEHIFKDKPCLLVGVTGGDEPIQLLQHLFHFALSMRMKPLQLTDYPFYGVGGKGRVTEDEDLKPLEQARKMGRKLVKILREKNGNLPHC
jgi:multimeric flavodoxin WrbA